MPSQIRPLIIIIRPRVCVYSFLFPIENFLYFYPNFYILVFIPFYSYFYNFMYYWFMSYWFMSYYHLSHYTFIYHLFFPFVSIPIYFFMSKFKDAFSDKATYDYYQTLSLPLFIFISYWNMSYIVILLFLSNSFHSFYLYTFLFICQLCFI